MNKIEIPTYAYMSVDYTDGLTGQAARDSYKGVNLRVEYGASRTDQRSYFTGDFVADYNAAVAFVEGFGQADHSFPFMGSSSVDSFMFDAGFEDAADAAARDADIPFASDADLERDQADQGAWAGLVATSFEEALEKDLPFLPTTEMDKTLAVSKRLEDAWGKVPAAKLQWAIANVIASSDYNTSYPGAPLGRDRAMQALKVLDELLADEALAAAMRPERSQ